MKIIISESQYGRLISKITGIKQDGSFLSKLKSIIHKDRDTGKMILKSVEDGNYEIDEKPTTNYVKFTIDEFPFVIERGSFGSKNYQMTLPLMNDVELSISDKILKKIFYIIAQEHMDTEDFMFMYFEDAL